MVYGFELIFIYEYRFSLKMENRLLEEDDGMDDDDMLLYEGNLVGNKRDNMVRILALPKFG
jgi:hypothetical protein